MLLLALCCSFSITTSAVDRSQPQDDLVTKKEKNVENMNDLIQPAKDKIKEIIALAKKYPAVENGNLQHVAGTEEIIENIERSYAKLTVCKTELRNALARIDEDGFLSRKDKLDKSREIEPIMHDVSELSSIIGSEIARVLDNITDPKARYDHSIKEYLQKAQSDVSVDSLLKSLKKNIAAHQTEIEKLKTNAKILASSGADDSDQEIEEASINQKIRKNLDIVSKRYYIFNETLKLFSTVKKPILDYITQSKKV